MAPSLPPDSDPGAAAVDGAVLGLLVWAVEVGALAAGALGIGGAQVLASLRDDLAGWGLGYLAVGGGLGLLRLTPAGRLGPVLGWGLLLLLGDPGIVPKPAHAALLLIAAALWALLGRIRATRALYGARASHGARALALAAATLLALALWPSPVAPTAGRPGPAPDVVLVIVDTLRADRLSHAGHDRPTSPHLDRLAADGLRFTRARATSSWTLPSHASLFTGLLPSEHGATASHPVLRRDLPTLAERFAARGYRTVGLSGNAWVSGGTGLDRGFQRFVFLGDEGLASQLLLPLLLSRPRDLGGRALTGEATRALGEAADTPLFLFVNYLEAHEPLGTVPDPRWPADPIRGRRWMRDMPRFWCRCDGDRAEPAPDGLSCRDGLYRAHEERITAASDAYDAGVAYVDGLIGALAGAIDRRGRPTWFVVTSDHGELLGEDGRMGHMVWLDDAVLDIPLIVRGPGVGRGTVDEQPIDLADLAPWLLAVSEGRPPPPRRLRAVSESHPHPAATAGRWGLLFGCDFEPISVTRRAAAAPDRTVLREGEVVTTREAPPGGPLGPPRAAQATERAWVDGPFADGAPVELDAATRRALQAIGYLE